jgi:hypothetical protein
MVTAVLQDAALILFLSITSVYHMGDITNACKILLENLKGRDHLGDHGIDKRITLQWVFKK